MGDTLSRLLRLCNMMSPANLPPIWDMIAPL